MLFKRYLSHIVSGLQVVQELLDSFIFLAPVKKKDWTLHYEMVLPASTGILSLSVTDFTAFFEIIPCLVEAVDDAMQQKHSRKVWKTSKLAPLTELFARSIFCWTSMDKSWYISNEDETGRSVKFRQAAIKCVTIHTSNVLDRYRCRDQVFCRMAD